MSGVSIRPLTAADAPAAAALWNACCDEPGGPLYRRLTSAEFDSLFRATGRDFLPMSRLAFDDGRLVGFANGAVRPGKEHAYVTVVMVAPTRRRRGTGRRLLVELEHAMRAAPGADSVLRFEIVFFNPITLTWIVPGTDGHDHPNSPGVDVAGGAYIFFKNHGYRDFACQNSYYLPLADYRYPSGIDSILSRLTSEGLRICRYDPDRHTGLDELLDDLGSDDWRQIVTSNFASGGPGEPVLIVEDGTRACGFTGPLHVEPSGRGYFAGIGVHSDYRGRGAAKALFAALCSELKSMGADFMSLFTGETNPARNIYEAAGFRIVRCWANMRKEFTR